jgi:hypothetical protein
VAVDSAILLLIQAGWVVKKRFATYFEEESGMKMLLNTIEIGKLVESAPTVLAKSWQALLHLQETEQDSGFAAQKLREIVQLLEGLGVGASGQRVGCTESTEECEELYCSCMSLD